MTAIEETQTNKLGTDGHTRPIRRFRRKMHYSPWVLLAQAIALVVFFGGWQFASGRFIDRFIIGDPLSIWDRLYQYIPSAEGIRDIRATLIEFVIGYGLGAGFGLVIGVILAQSRALSAVFGPFITALNGVPKIAVAPLFVIIFGIGIASKVSVAALSVFFVMFYSVYSGIRGQSTELIDVLRVIGATKFTIVTKVVIPQAMPSVIGGLRAGVPFGIIGVVVGEFIASDKGLGYFIVNATDHFDIDSTFAGVLILVAIVWLCGILLGAAEKRMLKHR